MNVSVDIIPLHRLALALIPVLVVILVQQRWALPVRPTIYGAARMLANYYWLGMCWSSCLIQIVLLLCLGCSP